MVVAINRIHRSPWAGARIEVDLFALRVTQEHDTWLEKGSRKRRWVPLKEAKQLLADGDVSALLAALSDREMARL